MPRRSNTIGLLLAGLAAVSVLGLALAATAQASTTEPGQAEAEQILAGQGEHDVAVVWTDDHRNCGAQASDDHLGGCWSPARPNAIYISPGLTHHELTYVVLHEYAHVLQHRNGAPLSECAADYQAVAWGADPDLATYRDQCAAVPPKGNR